MLTPKKVREQIEQVTIDLIEVGLCDSQSFPSLIKYSGNIEEIGVTNSENSIFLKSLSYQEMYEQLLKNKIYNIKMLDGALISMLYRFKDNMLVANRLSFFPSPNLETFQNEPEIYLEDELYGDILDKRIVTVPIRFDFDNDDMVYEPIEHPISHLTLGQYKNCRIPVSSALTPYQFISFIVMNFYHTAHNKYGHKLKAFKESFDITIFDEEKHIVHMHAPIIEAKC